MHSTVDYSKSPAPGFDAVEDIKTFLGEARYSQFRQYLHGVKNPVSFNHWCSFAGIEGAPVKYLYESIHGGDSWPVPAHKSDTEENCDFYGTIKVSGMGAAGVVDVYKNELTDDLIVRFSAEPADYMCLPWSIVKNNRKPGGMIGEGSVYLQAIELIERK